MPIVTQRKQIRLGSMKTRVQSLALLTGSGIWHCHEVWDRSQRQLRSCMTVAGVQAGCCSSGSTLSLGNLRVPWVPPLKKEKEGKWLLGASRWNIREERPRAESRSEMSKSNWKHHENLTGGSRRRTAVVTGFSCDTAGEGSCLVTAAAWVTATVWVQSPDQEISPCPRSHQINE